jgi:hypothetical protein
VDVVERAVEVARRVLAATRTASEPDVRLPEHDFDRLLTTVNDVTAAHRQNWRKRAADLTLNNASLIKLMARYIGLDLQLVPVEVSARRLQAIVDKWEDEAESEAREERAIRRLG